MTTDERWTRLYAELRENQRRAAVEPRPRVPKLAFVPLLLFWPAWVALAHLLVWLAPIGDDDDPDQICAEAVAQFEIDRGCVGVLPRA